MSPLAISFTVLVCIFGSAIFGLLVRARFPDKHLSDDTKEVVKLVIGIVGTMTGMVLGLLVASATSSFDSQRDGVAQLPANVVVLDRAGRCTRSEAVRFRWCSSCSWLPGWPLPLRAYGLFAPKHATTIAALLLGSFVVSCAVFLILELDHPFGGIMHISSQPLKNALLQIGR